MKLSDLGQLPFILPGNSGDIQWKSGKWPEIQKFVSENGLSGYYYVLLKNENSIPPEIKALWQAEYLRTALLNEELKKQLEDVAKEANRKNESVIALKGIYLAFNVYSSQGMRPMTDVDILTGNSFFESSEAVFRNLGFIAYKKETARELTPAEIKDKMFLRGNYIFDVQRLLVNEAFDREFFENALESGKAGLFFPAVENHLVFLCWHFLKHFSKEKVRYSAILDIALTLQLCKESTRWHRLLYLAGLTDKEYEICDLLTETGLHFKMELPVAALQRDLKLKQKPRDRHSLSYIRAVIENDEGSMRLAHTRSTFSKIKNAKGWYSKSIVVFRGLFPRREFMEQKYGRLSRWKLIVKYGVRLIKVLRRKTFLIF